MVMLALVHFTLVDVGLGPTKRVNGHPDLLHCPIPFPFQELGADDRNFVVNVECRHHPWHRGRIQNHVVMQQQDEFEVPRPLQAGRDGRAEGARHG